MKRILAVMMALAMLLTCAAALAENTYPLTDSGETFKLIIRMRPLHSDATPACISTGNRSRRQSTMK